MEREEKEKTSSHRGLQLRVGAESEEWVLVFGLLVCQWGDMPGEHREFARVCVLGKTEIGEGLCTCEGCSAHSTGLLAWKDALCPLL